MTGDRPTGEVTRRELYSAVSSIYGLIGLLAITTIRVGDSLADSFYSAGFPLVYAFCAIAAAVYYGVKAQYAKRK